MLISALLSLFLGIGGYFLLETWVEANAHEIAVPSWYNGWYDGGRFIGEFYRLPDGSDVGRFTDVRALAPAGVDPETWVTDEVRLVVIGVHAPDYPGWVATEIAAFGAFGVAWLAATFAIVERRRPF